MKARWKIATLQRGDPSAKLAKATQLPLEGTATGAPKAQVAPAAQTDIASPAIAVDAMKPSIFDRAKMSAKTGARMEAAQTGCSL